MTSEDQKNFQNHPEFLKIKEDYPRIAACMTATPKVDSRFDILDHTKMLWCSRDATFGLRLHPIAEYEHVAADWVPAPVPLYSCCGIGILSYLQYKGPGDFEKLLESLYFIRTVFGYKGAGIARKTYIMTDIQRSRSSPQGTYGFAERLMEVFPEHITRSSELQRSGSSPVPLFIYTWEFEKCLTKIKEYLGR